MSDLLLKFASSLIIVLRQDGPMDQFASNIQNLVQRFTPLRRLGWAFLLAWVFCVFYLGIIGERPSALFFAQDGALGASNLAQSLYSSCLPVGMSVLMLIFIVAMERRWGSPCRHKLLFIIAPVATAFSTPLLFVSTPSDVVNIACFTLGAMLTGFGSGFLWVMWGEYYARLSLEDVEFLAPVSAVIAALITLVMTAVEGWISVALGMLFPLVSGLCLWLSWQGQGVPNGELDTKGTVSLPRDPRAPRDPEGLSIPDGGNAQPAQGFGDMLHAIGRTGFGILSACLFVCFVGGFWEEAYHPVFDTQIVLLVSIAFMLAVGFSSMAKPRRVSLTFLYRWMCPALVLGLAAIVIGGEPWGPYIAFCVSIAARFAFCLMTQMYFARYAMSGRITAVQSYGLGWIFVHLGDLLGVLTLDNACVVAMALLVLAVMFVLNDDQSFAIYPDTGHDFCAGLSEARSKESMMGATASHVSRTSKTHALSDSNERPAASDQVGLDSQGTSSKSAFDSEEAQHNGDKREGNAHEDTQSAREARIASLAAAYHLTPRETEVFALLAQGRSVPYIRDALVISKETAATHAKRIYAKLGVHSRQDLIDLVQEGE